VVHLLAKRYLGVPMHGIVHRSRHRLTPAPRYLLARKQQTHCVHGHEFPLLRMWISGKPVCEICYDLNTEKRNASYWRREHERMEHIAVTPHFGRPHCHRRVNTQPRKKCRLYAAIPEGYYKK